MGSIEASRAKRWMDSRHLGGAAAALLFLAGSAPAHAARHDSGDPDFRALFLEMQQGDAPKQDDVAIPTGLPAERANLTSGFGVRTDPFRESAAMHTGIDLAAPLGTPVYATADGVISFAGRYPLRDSVAWWRFGNVVTINHNDRFVTIYGHCDTIRVQAGQQVKQGDVIATVGSTGWSTNPHLHYEVRSTLEQPGTYVPIDPRIYILNYQWSNEASLLMKSRTSKDYKDFDPLPPAFVGKRRG